VETIFWVLCFLLGCYFLVRMPLYVFMPYSIVPVVFFTWVAFEFGNQLVSQAIHFHLADIIGAKRGELHWGFNQYALNIVSLIIGAIIAVSIVEIFHFFMSKLLGKRKGSWFDDYDRILRENGLNRERDRDWEKASGSMIYDNRHEKKALKDEWMREWDIKHRYNNDN